MNAPTLIAADKIAFVTLSLTLAFQEVVRDTVGQNYTAGEVVTFFAAGGVLITGLGAVIVNIIVALKSGNKLDDSLANDVALAGAVKEVHTLTNSNLSQVKAELSKVVSQNAALHELVAELRSERDKAAITAAALAVPPVTP